MNAPRPRYLAMCAAEPFRIFFPLATLLGISGVSLWPLFFGGLHKFYPGIMHARLMIQGFLGGYLVGFLGTALPRMLSAPALRAWEVWPLVALHLLAAGLHIGHQHLLGDLAFSLLLVLFAVCLLRRVRQRRELPPPGFVLVALGYFSGLAGTLLWVAGTRGWVSGELMLLGGMWLNQAFVLLPVLGAGSYLFPRFLGLAEVCPMDDEQRASPKWRRRAAFSLATGLLLLGSYWQEIASIADGFSYSAPVFRGIIVLFYLAATVPIFRAPEPLKPVPLAIHLALAAILTGIVFPLFWPGQRIAGLHVIFLGGFSLVAFTVATRVVLGHSGHAHLCGSGLPSLRTATALILAATILRAVFDFLPERIAGLNGASYLWMFAALLWGCAILPKVRQAEAADDPPTRS